jgi:hypothetical protein
VFDMRTFRLVPFDVYGLVGGARALPVPRLVPLHVRASPAAG